MFEQLITLIMKSITFPFFHRWPFCRYDAQVDTLRAIRSDTLKLIETDLDPRLRAAMPIRVR